MFCNILLKEEIAMKNHPEWKDACDTVLSLLCGGFALLAVGIAWAKELVGRKKGKQTEK